MPFGDCTFIQSLSFTKPPLFRQRQYHFWKLCRGKTFVEGNWGVQPELLSNPHDCTIFIEAQLIGTGLVLCSYSWDSQYTVNVGRMYTQNVPASRFSLYTISKGGMKSPLFFFQNEVNSLYVKLTTTTERGLSFGCRIHRKNRCVFVVSFVCFGWISNTLWFYAKWLHFCGTHVQPWSGSHNKPVFYTVFKWLIRNEVAAIRISKKTNLRQWYIIY